MRASFELQHLKTAAVAVAPFAAALNVLSVVGLPVVAVADPCGLAAGEL